MNYKEALDYINNIQIELGSDLSLKEVKELSKRVGNPEKKLNIIHIAGTNGKGSVGNYICNILAMSGYKVGRYISPTLFDYREMVQYITGSAENISIEYASENEIAESISELKKKCGEMVDDGFKQPTAFEIETVMAFEIMAKWNLDIAVVEVGMGGRLDATNIIEKPVLSVITSISMDHMSFLGDTLEKIAYEKYGIIKENTPVVSAEQEEVCMNELKEICNKKNAPYYIVEKSQIKALEFKFDDTSFIYNGNKYTIRQGGIFQLENASLAVCVSDVLKKHGFEKINLKPVKAALSISRWHGRFEAVSGNPFVVVDGAHNPAAAHMLRLSLNTYFPGEKFNYIIGVFKDKDYKKILEEMLPYAKCVYAIDAPGKRGLKKEKLAECIRNMADKDILEIEAKDSIEDALNSIKSENSSDKTIVFGSLSFLHEIYQYFALDNIKD